MKLSDLFRFIARVKKVDRRRMKDLREEVGTKASIVGKIVKSRMKSAGHMVRMKDERSPTISKKVVFNEEDHS